MRRNSLPAESIVNNRFKGKTIINGTLGDILHAFGVSLDFVLTLRVLLLLLIFLRDLYEGANSESLRKLKKLKIKYYRLL